MSQNKKPPVDNEVKTASPSYPEWQMSTTVYNRSDLDAAEAADKITVTEVPLTHHEKPAKETPKEAPLSRRNRTNVKRDGAAAGVAAGASASAASARTRKQASGTTSKSKSAPKGKSSAKSKAEPQTEEPIRRSNSNKNKKKKKGHPILKGILLFLICSMLIVGGIVFYYVYSVISETPPIDPTNIADMLNETSVMYDANGNEIDAIFSGTNREMASIDDIPKHVQDAFIAIEDKTFRTHHGFNFRRIIGAVLEYVLPGGGGQISGTSTITQQLARNVFLTDSQFEYSIKRKIAEAYYSLKIEKALSKEEILEAYLNTIYFGYGSWGIETAAQSYFKKSVSELTIAEAATLAALPQLPDGYQLVNFVEGGTADQYPDIALKETADGVYIANDISRERRNLCLALMLEQELITQEEYDAAIKVQLMDMLNPDFTTYNSGPATYFADYVITEVINDLQEEKGLDYTSAWRLVYQGGLTIYSTMDPVAQQVIANEFANPENYPEVYPEFDSEGNVINEHGMITLRSYDNAFDENGNYYLHADEYDRLADGRMIIFYGNFLKIYKTDVHGETDYSLEFPSMYYYDDNWDYYTISGGYINIPMNYKSANSDGDLIISADFFNDYPDFFVFNDDGSCMVPSSSYSLGSKTIQPQAAMTIVENKTGHIIAMVGGRTATGRQIFNRAISPRQSGSSIKPLAVYSAALQQSVDEMRNGERHTFVNYGIDKQGANLYGAYLTAASIVVDEKTTIGGEVWPVNSEKKYVGPVTLRQAMIDSINTCAVKLWYQVGVDYSFENVKKFGITTLVEEGDVNDLNAAALALGSQTYGVTTLEMASAFSTFPNNGVRYETTPYTKVLDRHGNVLLEKTPVAHEVLDPGVAWIMTDIMHGVVTRGTGTNANIPDTFVGGKTGTTQDSYDIWFDGFTNNYSASVWIGSDITSPLSTMSSTAASMWGKIMSQLEGSYLGERAPMPDDVIIVSGEYFVAGTEKELKSIKDYEKKIKICKESGLLATPECKDVEESKYISYDDEALKELPKEYCHLHNPDPSKYPTTPEGEKIYEEKKQKEDADNKAAADPVIALINALPASPTPADEAAIVAARTAYNALNDKQKAAVGNDLIAKLSDAETKLAAAKQAAADAAAQKAAEEEARKAACQQWLADRENHKNTWVETSPAEYSYYTQQDWDDYVAQNGSNPTDWKVGDVKELIKQAEGYYDYDDGYRDGQFHSPPCP